MQNQNKKDENWQSFLKESDITRCYSWSISWYLQLNDLMFFISSINHSDSNPIKNSRPSNGTKEVNTYSTNIKKCVNETTKLIDTSLGVSMQRSVSQLWDTNTKTLIIIGM